MAQKLSYLKYLLWWIGIIKNCPKCGSKILKIDKGGWNLYKCGSSECNFGKERLHYPWEIWSR